jgi:putative phosphoesterase
MKVLVISDSHGDQKTVEEIIRKEKPDLSLHLGDFGRDLKEGISVRGNCDGLSHFPLKRIFELKGHRIMMSHGHKEGVKRGLNNLYYHAKEQGVNIVLFGHTHLPLQERIGDILFLNPGSVSLPPPGRKGSYLILELEQGKIEAQFEQIMD